MSESKVSKLFKRVSKLVKIGVKDKVPYGIQLPKGYEARKGQIEFIDEVSKAIKNKAIFFASAPCGIGKSLGALLAVLPQLGENKLLICFRTRSQLHIYLKELRALRNKLSAVSLFSKLDMCPLRLRGGLSYRDFLEECWRLRENGESNTIPYCKFYRKITKKKKEAEELALDCAQKFLAPRETVRRMSKFGFCAYESLKLVLHRVPIFLGTYHYAFNPQVRETLLSSFGVGLSNLYLIVDEAHNLPAFSRELLSDKLTLNTLEGALKETETFEHELVPSVREYLMILDKEILQQAQVSLERGGLKQLKPQAVSDKFLSETGTPGLEAAKLLHGYGEHVRETRQALGYDRIFSYNHRVGEFMENFFEKEQTKHFHLIKNDLSIGPILEVRSFDGRELTNSILQEASGSILMSGFLSPPKVYRDLMLYEQSEANLREFESPFPSENRLILAARDVSSRFKKRTDEMLEKWRNYIKAISDVNNGNMAVFFTSYELMHTILSLVNTDRKEIVEQRKTKRREVIEHLNKSTNNILLGVMGGKFSEGIDYPNNLLTCVVTVGLPYATWTVYQKALIGYFDYQFPGNGRIYAYIAPAILRLIQTCGRVHRSASDKGCIIILDERVTHPSIKQQLPSYYQKEMEIVSSPIDCAHKIREFWARSQNVD